MGRLKIFIDRIRDHGAEFRQDFPAQCVPLLRGNVLGALDAYTTP
jgi:hypothetical protein